MSGKIISFEKQNIDTESKASTAFCIIGIFDPDEITAKLNLKPSKSWKINERVQSKKYNVDAGLRRTFSLWSYGYNDSYNGDISHQIRTTIDDLKSRVPFIKEIMQKYDCKAYIEVICDATVGDKTPNFSIDTDIIDFCKLIGARIDVDLNIF